MSNGPSRAIWVVIIVKVLHFSGPVLKVALTLNFAHKQIYQIALDES